MAVQHRTTIGEQDLVWEVDTAACASAAPWASRSPGALHADLESMAAYFPHWVLAGASSGRPARCQGCQSLLVPRGGGMRCVACGAAGPADGLAWVGHIPALARPEPRFAARRASLRAAGFPEAEAGGEAYLLVPLAVAYPQEWPAVEPAVRYAGRWLDALGLPRGSAAHHLLGGGHACLFAYGQWRAMAVHQVLQQRVVNHIASLLKIAAGQSPQQAFIGRIDHQAWAPE